MNEVESYNKVEDFLRDDSFIRNILAGSSISDKYVSDIRKKNEGCEKMIDEAVSILTCNNEKRLTDVECKFMKERIWNTLHL